MTRRTRNHVWRWVLGGAGVATLGCGASSSPDGAAGQTVAASGVIVCNEYTSVHDRELYVLGAIQRKLRNYPEFASAANIQTVSSCDEARVFIRAYERYSIEHPGFDAHEPVAPPDDLPPLPDGPAPTLYHPKIFNGSAPSTASLSANSPVVLVEADPPAGTLGPDGGLLHEKDCTGTFIAKHWIATAAHCLGVVPGGEGTLDGYFHWRIGWADANGSLIAPTILDAHNVLQYADPSFLGGPLIGGNSHDFALLYLPAVQIPALDGFLPADADAGGSMRIGAVDPAPTGSYFFAGYGTNALLVGARSSLTVTTNDLEWTVNTSSEPVTCSGDSGGPLFRNVNLGGSPPKIVPVLVGTLRGFTLDDQPLNPVDETCGAPGMTQRFINITAEQDFIDTRMNRWNGQNRCAKANLNDDFFQCWGVSCKDATKCGMNEFCYRPGPLLSGPCPVCGDGTCNCIFGECQSKL